MRSKPDWGRRAWCRISETRSGALLNSIKASRPTFHGGKSLYRYCYLAGRNSGPTDRSATALHGPASRLPQRATHASDCLHEIVSYCVSPCHERGKALRYATAS